MTHISNVGILGGTGKNEICRDLADYRVPLGFAKYLEHLGTYIGDGLTMQSSYDLTAGLSVTSQAWSHTSGGTLGLVVPGGSNITYYTVSTGSGNVGEYNFSDNALAAPLTLPIMWSSVGIDISQAIAAAGLSCILYKDIPKQAPNSSAYTNIVDPLTGLESVNLGVGVQVVGIAPDFHPEEALLFSCARGLQRKFTMPIFKALPNPQPQYIIDTASASGSQIDSRFSAPFFNAWIGARQTAFRKGPILKSYTLCESKIKHLVFTHQPMDSGSVFRVAYKALAVFLSQVTVTVPDLDVSRLTYLYFQVLFHMLVARVTEASPIPTMALNNGSAAAAPTVFAPQGFYTTRAWLGLPVPAAIARFVDSIGPVNANGRVIVPLYIAASSNASRYPNGSNGTSFPGYSIGQSAARLGFPGGFLGQNGITAVTGAEPATYAFAPQGVAITSADLVAYYPNGQAHLRSAMWNANVAYFINLWDRLHKKYLTGATLSSSMIHTHNPPCGAVTALLTTTAVQVQDASVNIPDLDQAGFTLVYQDYEAFSIGSYVNLAAEEIVEATIFRFSTVNYTNEALAMARYRYQLPVTSASSTFLTDYCQKTFTPESAFSKALALRQAKFDPVASTIKGIDLVRIEETDGCYVKDLLKGVGREIFSAARFAAPVALGTLCAGGGPMASKVCAAAGDSVVKSIGSFMGIEADGHKPVKPADIAKASKMASPPPKKPTPPAVKGLSLIHI